MKKELQTQRTSAKEMMAKLRLGLALICFMLSIPSVFALDPILAIVDCEVTSQDFVQVDSYLPVTATVLNLKGPTARVTVSYYLTDCSGNQELVDSASVNVPMGTTDVTLGDYIPSSFYTGFLDYEIVLTYQGFVKDTWETENETKLYEYSQEFTSSTWDAQEHGCTSCYQDYGCDLYRYGATTDAVSLSSGKLRLDIHPESQQNTGELRGGHVESSQPNDCRYGTYFARINMKLDHDYANGNFWLRGANNHSITMECFKVGSSYKIYCALWNGGSSAATLTSVSVSNPGNGYHEFAIEWLPNSVTWYYDGNQIAKCTNSNYITSSDLWLVLSYWMNPKGWWMSPSDPDCDIEYNGTPDLYMLTDWVRW